MKTMLVIVAHPDDADFGSGGTIAAFVRAGVKVHYCVVTSGDAGGFEDEGQSEIANRREIEQREAANVYGVDQIFYLRERDGYVEPNLELQKKIIRVIRTVRPDTILTQHPERTWDSFQRSHPDHLAVGEAVTRAAYPGVENAYAFPELRSEEGLEPFKLHQMLLMAAPWNYVNVAFDVREHVDDKISALLEHGSQHPDVPRMKAFVRQKLTDLYQETTGNTDEGFAEVYQHVIVNNVNTVAGF